MQATNGGANDPTDIEADIIALENNYLVGEAISFDGRADALDLIEFHIIDRIDSLPQSKEFDQLKQRALVIRKKLEGIDLELFKQLREDIGKGVYLQATFSAMVSKYLRVYFRSETERHKIGYDNLDSFINGLLSFHDKPGETLPLHAEMVFYQKTPARIVFKMAQMAAFNKEDVFFDIGSGLGQVAILINLISGARSKGIEYEPAYCKYANERAKELNLTGVEFINADARAADHSKGTVFFMYTPFTGSVLQDVLQKLRKQSQHRLIRLFTYGPVSAAVAHESWLNCVNGNVDSDYELYEFRSLLKK